ncbi:MAG: hypothetical protein ACRDTZ_03820 [Pseudonocardiaceae bacterium]
MSAVVVHGPPVLLPAVGALRFADRLTGCVVCRASTAWAHPVAGGLHPGCVAPALAAGLLDEAAAPPVAVVARGAYARRAART